MSSLKWPREAHIGRRRGQRAHPAVEQSFGVHCLAAAIAIEERRQVLLFAEERARAVVRTFERTEERARADALPKRQAKQEHGAAVHVSARFSCRTTAQRKALLVQGVGGLKETQGTFEKGHFAQIYILKRLKNFCVGPMLARVEGLADAAKSAAKNAVSRACGVA